MKARETFSKILAYLPNTGKINYIIRPLTKIFKCETSCANLANNYLSKVK